MGHRITKFRIPLAGRQPLTPRAADPVRDAKPCSKAANDDDGRTPVPNAKPRKLSVETWDINGAF